MTSNGIYGLTATLAATLLLAACGSSSGSASGASGSVSQPSASTPATTANGQTSTSGVTSGGTVHVTIKGLAFHPASVNAKVGDTVVFVNQDGPAHNVAWVSGPKFATSSQLATGATFTLTVNKSGTIHYYCSIHPFMKGTILVTK